MIDDKYEQNRKVNPKEVFVSTIAYDFQYVSKEGKLTLPWINKEAIKKINVLQNDVFAFADSTEPPHLEIVNEESVDKLILDPTKELQTIDQGIEIKKNTMLRTKTIKIPFVTFEKIYNFRYPPILSKTIDIVDDVSDSQLEILSRQEGTAQYEHSVEAEDIRELNDTNANILGKYKLENNQTNGFNKKLEVNKKSIKISFTTLQRLLTRRFPFKFTYTASSKHSQSKTDNEHIGASHTSNKIKVEDKFILDKVLENRDSYNQRTLQNDHDVYKKHSYKVNIHTNVRSKIIIVPFSTFVEVDNFLHPPIFGNTIQHTFYSFEQNDRQIPSLSTKIIDTTTHYHEKPFCHLLGFKSHEIVYSTEKYYKKSLGNGKDNSLGVAVPLHGGSKENIAERDNSYVNNRFNIRVPVILGEYNIEFSLEQEIPFEDKIFQIKEISKEVEVIDCKFVPQNFSHPNDDGNREVLEGKLFLEGFIKQQIEYSTFHDTNESTTPMNLEKPLYPLHQKIILELIIQLLQVQKTTLSF
ncbi:BC_2427 family protein [Bacillus sp. FJAT-22090]|uniref:BC_2427 family protein n=1 Tax=Bacillus sp. FJAT-22090 TaxID=1581038 RepID=UPI0011A52759|nr:hypothetical protein [Bacillus sp. FJAT-22090]